MIDRFIDDAESSGRPVVVVGTAAASKLPVAKIESPNDARSTASALLPQPFEPDRTGAVSALETALKAANGKSPSIIWLHDGLDHKSNAGDIGKKLAALAGSGSFAVLDETKGHEPLGLTAHLGDKGKLKALVLSPGGSERDGSVNAYSARGERLGEAPFKLNAGARSADVTFELPLELRNQVARIELAGERSAGAVNLIDAATQWHRVGLHFRRKPRGSATAAGAALLHSKSAEALCRLAVAQNANLSQGLDSILKQNISVLMLADIGTLTGEAAKKVDDFVKRGGLLVRFAGPRLEKAGDDLLPVPLRSGGRSLGGALSWSSPQALAAFDENSPFAGLTIPADVTVNRQVLADPAQLTPEVEIWARLKDGTPLVTATKHGNGRLVLFHVTANSDWSNFPISGLFVEMLRRLSTMGTIGASGQGGSETKAGTTADADANANVLAPMKTLDGQGALRSPPPTAEPIKASELQTTSPSFEHPPGYYGQSASPRALNILTPKSTLVPFPEMPASVTRLSYANAASTRIEARPARRGAGAALCRYHRHHPAAGRWTGRPLFASCPAARDCRRVGSCRSRLYRQFPTPEPRTCRRSMRFRRRRKGPERSRSDRRINPPPTRRPSPRRPT